MRKTPFLLGFCLLFSSLAEAQTAWQLDGLDDYAEVADYPALHRGVREFTLEATVDELDFTSSNQLTLLDKRNATQTQGIYWAITPSTLEFQIENQSLSVPHSLGAGCQHLAVVRLADKVEFFVNGNSVALSTIPIATNMDSPEPLFIGRSAEGASFFHGQLDELRIWKKARTAADLNLYKNTCLPLSQQTADLIAYWNLDENSGNFGNNLASFVHYARMGGSLTSDTQEPQWTSSNCVLAGCCAGLVAGFTLPPLAHIGSTQTLYNNSTRATSIWWIINETDTIPNMDTVVYTFQEDTTVIQLVAFAGNCKSVKTALLSSLVPFLVNPPLAICPDTITDICDFVCHGDLENYQTDIYPAQHPSAQAGLVTINHQFRISYRPQELITIRNTPDLWNSVNNPVLTGSVPLGMLSARLGFGGSAINVNKPQSDLFITIGEDSDCDQTTFEAIYLPLHTPLPAGTYTITMDVASGYGPRTFFAVLAENPPLQGTNALGVNIVNSLQSPNYGQLLSTGVMGSTTPTNPFVSAQRTIPLTFTASTPATPPLTTLSWQTISATFTIGNNNANTLSHLIIYLEPSTSQGVPPESYYAIDNIRITGEPELQLTQSIVSSSIVGNFRQVVVAQTVCLPHFNGTIGANNIVQGTLQTTTPAGWTFVGGVPNNGISQNNGVVSQPFTLNAPSFCRTVNYTYRIPIASGVCGVDLELCAVAVPAAHACFSADTSCIGLPLATAPGQAVIVPASVTTFDDAINVAGLLLPAATAVTTPQNVIFLGDIEQDLGVYTFAPGSEIRMMGGVSLSVPYKSELRLVGTYVHAACDELWESILLLPGGILRSSQSTRIEDGYHAVEARSGLVNNAAASAQVYLENTRFNKNFVGLYIPPPTTTTGNSILIGRFDNNVFECLGCNNNAGLLNAFPGQPTPSGRISYAGVEMYRQSGFNIPTNTATATNTFRSMANGIVAFQSNMNIQRARFLNINSPSPAYSMPLVSTNGFGIYANGQGVNPRLEQKGFGQNIADPVSFSSCEHGIWAIHYNMDVSGNRMAFMRQTGVHLEGALAQYFAIYKNRMDILRNRGAAGVRLLQNDGGGAAQINKVAENIINIGVIAGSFPADAAIMVQDGGLGYVNGFMISSNVITVETAMNGIWLQNCLKAQVLSDTIWIHPSNPFLPNSADERIGINVEASGFDRISNNVVSILNLPQLPPNNSIIVNTVGMRVNQHENGLYSCNSFRRTFHGLRFEGICGTASIIQGNVFERHRYGLYYTALASTGPQFNQGNRWLGNWLGSNRTARHDGNLGVVLGSLYTVQNLAGINPQPVSTQIPALAGTWFNTQGQSTWASCPALLLSPAAPGINNADIAVANNLNMSNHPGTDWKMRSNLYRKLDRNPALRQHPLMQQFYANYTPQPLGEVVYTETYRDTVPALDTTILIQLIAQSETDAALLDSLVEVDSLMSMGLLSVTDWETRHGDYLEQLRQNAAAAQSLQQNIAAQATAESQTAQAINQGIAPQYSPESNEQIVNEVYLQTVAVGLFDFTPAQVAALESVADQCPLEGGTAVYFARSIYALFAHRLYADNCDETPQMRMAQDACWEDVAFVNPSLEDTLTTTMGGYAPQDWVICQNSPDYTYGGDGINVPFPSDQLAYEGMGGGYISPTILYTEAMGQELSTSLAENLRYVFSMDVSYTDVVGDVPCAFSISFGDTLCQEDQLVYWEDVTDTAWVTKVVDFVANGAYKYVTVSSQAPQSMQGGYSFIDNFRSVPCDTTSSIVEPTLAEQSETLLVYPNPNSGNLSIEYEGEANPDRIEIVDALGRVVFRQTVETRHALSLRQTFHIENIPNGFYTVVLRQNAQIVARAKLVVAK